VRGARHARNLLPGRLLLLAARRHLQRRSWSRPRARTAAARARLGGVGAAIDGLVAAARWVVEHAQLVIIVLLFAYIAAARAGSVTGAGARPAPVGRTLDQLVAGSARYDTYCPCSRGCRPVNCT